ncbi:hypothetical protein [Xenorhabdus littoralis]|uniref:hypothetical protein n=1 Tax=Xenorhabdus littoralis TaxID=2582835 RepID=UPI0029E7CD32|nr:hypothetical protein [Xenorhabdus sp. psl]
MKAEKFFPFFIKMIFSFIGETLAIAVDHFYTKLFKIESGFQTASGRQMASERAERMKQFLDVFLDEIQVEPAN